MKIRIAKKILLAPHWVRRWEALRPPYYDERGVYCIPSRHDLPDARFQKARHRFFRYWSNYRKKIDNKK